MGEVISRKTLKRVVCVENNCHRSLHGLLLSSGKMLNKQGNARDI